MRLKLSGIFLFFPFWAMAQSKTYWSPEQVIKMKVVTAVQVSPDAKKIVYAVRETIMSDERSEFINNLFVCSSDGNDIVQLTRGDKNSSNPKWSPDSKWIAFTSNRDSKNNLYLFSLAGGEAEKITDVKTNIVNFEWNRQGDAIAFTMPEAPSEPEEKNRKSKNDSYFYEVEIKQNRLHLIWLNKRDSSGKRLQKILTGTTQNINSFDWSPDGNSIVYSHGKSPKVNDNIYSDISILEIETRQSKVLANTNAGESNPVFSHDGKWIAYVCTEDPLVWAGKSFIQLMSVLGSRGPRLIETPNTLVGAGGGGAIIGWTNDNKYVYVSEASKTLTGIYKLGVDGKDIVEWNKGTGDLIGTISMNKAATHLGFSLQNTTTAPEIFISSLGQYEPVKITNVNAELSGKPVPKTEVIRWKSFDGLEIEGLLTYPLNYEKGKKYPLILNIHGGPSGVFLQNFIGNPGAYPIAALAESGFFVLRPNPRGSTGYGANFLMGNLRDWGGGDYKDLLAGVDFVIKTGMVDKDKLGVCGWSYGGFMSSWIVGHTNLFKAASVGAPVVDLVYQNLTDDIAGFLPSYMKSEPWNDWKVYDEHSPLRFVQNVKTPVLLQHGDADVRVPVSHSYMYYNALKRRNIPVRFLVLPRQGHGLAEPRMVLKAMQSNLEWFENYLSEKEKGF